MARVIFFPLAKAQPLQGLVVDCDKRVSRKHTRALGGSVVDDANNLEHALFERDLQAKPPNSPRMCACSSSTSSVVK